MSDLKDIGFYTLSNDRAATASSISKLMRCELLITDRCNFKCPYCRGTVHKGDIAFSEAIKILAIWFDNGLVNVRFTGGEPTLHPNLPQMVKLCKENSVKRIAISTNGTPSLEYYKTLIDCGVNDFSISLDGACCSIGDMMSGGAIGAWNKVVRNIIELSKLTYVSVGMVFTKDNVSGCVEAVKFASSLGISDIRVIPSAQFNKALLQLAKLPDDFLNKYPILNYRVQNLRYGIHVRGLSDSDTQRCPLVLDDMCVAGGFHYPCVIYMREQGQPIGKVGLKIRQERYQWFTQHNTFTDNICKRNCLDVCRDYNNRWMVYHNSSCRQ